MELVGVVLSNVEVAVFFIKHFFLDVDFIYAPIFG